MAKIFATLAVMAVLVAGAVAQSPAPAAGMGAAAPAPSSCQTIWAIAQTLPNYSTLVAAGKSVPAVQQLLDGKDTITVFAPDNAAFEAALKALGLTTEQLLADQATLTKVLQYHVVDGKVDSKSLKEGDVTTKAGAPVKVSLANGAMINDAKVVVPDVMACNGVVHGIDKVLVPPGVGAPSSGTATAGRKLL